MKHIPFPDIGQFRNVIRNVKSRAQYIGKDTNGDPIYDPLVKLPTLEFEGTVKLHGTNSGIVHSHEDDKVWYQSRENIITVENDNAGFARFCIPIQQNIIDNLFPRSVYKTYAVFGEWCGQGIQKGVAVSQLSKRLVVFAIKQDDQWLSSEYIKTAKIPSLGIYNIYDYPTWRISIDFNHPEESQNKLGEYTLAVEQECPFGKAFGVSGIGEGIVWRCVTPGWEDPQFWMKVKGEKHSVSKVKTLAPIDVELMKSQREFVEKVVTDVRCEQSISKLKETHKPLDRTSLGDFIRWIYLDIIKEESDTAKSNGFDLNKMGGLISQQAKKWFFSNELKF